MLREYIRINVSALIIQIYRQTRLEPTKLFLFLQQFSPLLYFGWLNFTMIWFSLDECTGILCSHHDDIPPSSFLSPRSFKGTGTLLAASHLFLSLCMSIFSLQSTPSVCPPVQRCEAKLHMRLERGAFLHSFRIRLTSLRNVVYNSNGLKIYVTGAPRAMQCRAFISHWGTHADTEACTHSLCSSTDLPASAMLGLTGNDAVLQKGALPAV